MMVECYEMIRAIWNSSAPYEFSSEHFQVSLKDSVNHELEIGYMPTPFQKPFPRVATTAMSPFSGTAKLAGAKDWDLMSANFNPTATVASHWLAYCQGAESAGIKADANNWRVARSVFVADSQAHAEDYLAQDSCTLRRYFDYMIDNLSSNNYTKIFKTRPDMTDGCNERFDLGFFLYLLAWNTGPRIRTEARLDDFKGRLVRLKTPRALQDWLETLPARA